MPKLADASVCTGCGACAARCVKSCIRLVKDELDNLYPKIDTTKCVDCKLCEQACPALCEKELLINPPHKAYATWSNHENIRKKSASGGVAAELYYHAQKNGFMCYGVVLNDEWTAQFICAKDEEQAGLKFQNSKYTYSKIEHVLPEIKSALQCGKKIFIVGLPCQIAGLKKYLGKQYDNLVTADLICHGVCSNDYLKQHISAIKKNEHQKGINCSFRNPEYDTENCCFTVSNQNNDVFYHKMVNENDVYQLGYHRGIIYRESCYHCRYASGKRIGDLMLGDYWLLGSKSPFPDSTHHVSLVYIMTQMGKRFLQDTAQEGLLTIVERPIEESLETQAQLNHPTRISPEQRTFVKKYKKSHDFEVSARYALKLELFCNKYKISKLFRFYKMVRRKILRG